jgi:Rv2632c-like
MTRLKLASVPNAIDAWTMVVVFTEDADRTRADARTLPAQREWHGRGQARRKPVDPDVQTIREELAAARALSDLSRQFVDAAAHAIEKLRRAPVHLHA